MGTVWGIYFRDDFEMILEMISQIISSMTPIIDFPVYNSGSAAFSHRFIIAINTSIQIPRWNKHDDIDVLEIDNP